MSDNVLGAIADGGHAASARPGPEVVALALGVAAFAVNFVHGPERVLAVLVTCLVGVLVLGLGARATGAFGKTDALRAAGLGAVVLGAVISVAPALWTLFPGTPEAEVDVTDGTSAKLDAKPGHHRLLLTGHLPHDQSADDAQFDLDVGGSHVNGEFVRTFVRSRAGRRASSVSSQEHAASFHDANIGGDGTVKLVVSHGHLDGPMHIASYPGLPAPWLYAIAGCAFLLAAFLDDRLGTHLRLSTPVAAGLAYGLFMYRWATPVAASGAALGSAVLGFVAGMAAAWLASLVMKATRPKHA